MKRELILKAMVITMVFVLGSAIAQISAQPKTDYVKNDLHVKTLVRGILSSNTGLAKSSIYFAGKYQIAEAATALRKVVKDSQEQSLRILAALSLYYIGDNQGMQMLDEIVLHETDARAKKMFLAITTEYKANNVIAQVK